MICSTQRWPVMSELPPILVAELFREINRHLVDLLRSLAPEDWHTAPKTTIHADRRFVDNGRVVCSAGIAAGIDMSLHVVARLLGREVAKKTAHQMEYPWQP